MKAYFFSDDELDEQDLYFIMQKLFSSHRRKTAMPRQHLPISDDEIVELAKHLNLSIDGLSKVMNDNL